MQVDLRILRFDPEQDTRPHWERYKVEAEPTDRVLDLLHRGEVRPGRHACTFRRSCAHGICGSDAMLINGRNGWPARSASISSVGARMTVAPAAGSAGREGPRGRHGGLLRQVPAGHALPRRRGAGSGAGTAPVAGRGRARYDDTTKCILCAACTSSCPSFWAQPEYIGPAAIVNAHRFIFDSRDEAADERLEILAERDGVWHCRTIFNCVDACPRGIKITQAILEVSGAIVERRT
ncbi:MAG: succinate dehydrogenase iron-sulfur subunit [Chloroflexota bacterium]|nr:MAG: succinate dehydrogenase iron-sulfur subunit [Chloroflexota bacterium]